jgi:two-component system, cell cycle sensor histidine kinase and response regulator CckA
LRILLVDSSPDESRITTGALASTAPDMLVEQVDTLASARTRLGRAPAFDAAVVAQALPDGDGLELASWVRASETPVPVLVLAATGDRAAAVAAVRAGAADLIVRKPGYTGHLAPAIRLAVQRFQRAGRGPGSPVRVLYADPDAAEREALVRHLARHAPHLRVTPVADPAEVLVNLPSDPAANPACDVVLAAGADTVPSALSLPDVLARLGHGIPVVLLVAPDDSATIAGVVRSGVDNCVIRTGAYREVLVAALDRSAHRAALAREQEAAREASARLGRMLATSPAILYAMKVGDGRLTLTWVSGNLTRIMGFTPEEALAPGWWEAHIPPEDRDQARAESQRVLSLGYVVHRYRFLDAQRRVRWIRDEMRLLRDDHGHPAEVIGSWNDVTLQQRAEEEARSLQQRSEIVFRQASDGMHLLDDRGRVVDANDAFCRMLGYSRDEALRLTTAELAAGPDPAALLDALLAAARGQTAVEARYRHRDGGVRHVEVTAAELAIGNTPHLFAAARDITDRHRAEAEQRTRTAALEAAANAIVITDPDGTIQWANPAFSRTTGYTLSEALGRNPRDLLRSGRHDRSFYERLWATISSGRVWQGEIENRRKDGSLYAEEMTITPVTGGPDGAITHYIAVKQDITARRQAEEQRGALEEQLRQAQKLEAVGTLASGVAHDFNNVLTAILGNTDLALEALPDDHPAAGPLQAASAAGRRARDLVRQILTFSRHDPPDRVLVPLGAALTDAVRFLRAAIPAGVTLAVEQQPDAPAVLADPTQLHQVIVNLCTNAWQAMNGHGGTIRIGAARQELGTEAPGIHPDLRPGTWAVLTVSDTGSGMTPEVAARIFDPFFTTKGPGEGTGLGLSVVLGIVQSGGGAITVRSTPGAGSTFTVFLPEGRPSAALAAAAVAAERPAPDHRRPSRPLRVLCVDDEPELVSLCTRILTRHGHHATGHTVPGEALAVARRDPGAFDAVICDLNMPGMSGIVLATELARLRPDLPVVVASGFLPEELRAEAAAAGVRAILPKPYGMRDLVRCLEGLAPGGP